MTARLWVCSSLPFRDPSRNYKPFDPEASAVRTRGVSVSCPWGTRSISNLTCAFRTINVLVVRNASVAGALKEDWRDLQSFACQSLVAMATVPIVCVAHWSRTPGWPGHQWPPWFPGVLKQGVTLLQFFTVATMESWWLISLRMIPQTGLSFRKGLWQYEGPLRFTYLLMPFLPCEAVIFQHWWKVKKLSPETLHEQFCQGRGLAQMVVFLCSLSFFSRNWKHEQANWKLIFMWGGEVEWE